ncbi:MAG: hypothetical protein ABJD24_08730 [Acidimicrobiales bacterium]
MTRRLRTAAVSVALVGALAACGGGSSSSSSKTTAKASTPGNVGTNGTDGITGSTDAATDESITIDTSFTGKGSDAVCNYAKDLEATDFGGDSTSATDLKASFTKIEEVLNNIKDKAPDEIKADVDTMFTGYQKLIDLYKKYDYDTAKMVAAAANDPDLAAQFAGISSAEMTAATARVSAYFSNVCGLTTATS